MKFSLHHESRIGGRASNQDRLLYQLGDKALLMIVADGMGGHSHGEIAAQIATVRIAKFFEQHTMPHIADPEKFLVDALLDAHQAVKTLTSHQPRPPHTTCVACIVQEGCTWWAHAGDSRLYVMREGKLLVRTRDHSYVEALLKKGLISPEEALKHPQRNLVLSCLGARDAPYIECAQHALQPGDVLLLCSDGVWEPVGDQAIVDAFAGKDLPLAATQILDRAEHNAGDNGDNLTLIAMQWEGAGMPAKTKSVTSPEWLSDEEIDRAIADIRNRFKSS